MHSLSCRVLVLDSVRIARRLRGRLLLRRRRHSVFHLPRWLVLPWSAPRRGLQGNMRGRNVLGERCQLVLFVSDGALLSGHDAAPRAVRGRLLC